eukprot:3487474-Prymnesium_polylepis.1
MVHCWRTSRLRVDCRAESRLLSRREPAVVSRWKVDQHRKTRRSVALACSWVVMTRPQVSAVRREQTALCRRLGVCCQTAAQKQRHRNERRELRPCLHRAFESTYPAAPGR